MPKPIAKLSLRPESIDHAIEILRSGPIEDFYVRDTVRTYKGAGRPGPELVSLRITSEGGSSRKKDYPIAEVERFLRSGEWSLWSELDQMLTDQRYVRLDPDTCAKLAVQIVHKAMRNPLEKFHDRISDKEMKAFNKGALNAVFTILVNMFNPEIRSHWLDKLYMPVGWDPPEIHPAFDPWAGWRFKKPDLTPTWTPPKRPGL